MISHKRAKEIVNGFNDRNIVVLGDLMLDEFIWGEVKRISPEAPVPVVEVRRETLNPGGAGNVVSNLMALGARAVPVGVVGDDDAGSKIKHRFSETGADISGVITDSTRPTTRKTRIVAHSQQMVRADREDCSAISPEIEARVIEAIGLLIKDADAVIISDYDKGLLTRKLLEETIGMAKSFGKPICLDPKVRNFSNYRNVYLVTPNQHEAERATNIEITDGRSLLEAARSIRRMLECENVLITRGEFGMFLLEGDDEMTDIPTVAREVFDVTGAGDTVIASLTLALAAGAGLKEAAIIANHAARVVVAKVGTATVAINELLATLGDLDQ